MRAFTVLIDDDVADEYLEEAQARRTTAEELIASAAVDMLPEIRQPMTAVTAAENAAIARAVADIEAGRLSSHDEVFARLDAKHGW